MSVTIEFLEAIKAKKSITSDYKLAQMLGATKQTISGYRNGKSNLDDSMALRVANLLEIDPAQVIASAHFERAKRPEEKAVWHSILQRLGRRESATSAASQPPDIDAAPLAETAETAPLKIM